MLHQGKKLFLFLCLLVGGCDNDKKKEEDIPFQKISERIIGKEQYDLIRSLAVDTVSSWIENRLSSWKDEKLETSLVLDSLMCINSKSDKLVAALLARTLDRNYTMDGVHFLYGIKIRNQWYFFTGPHIAVPRKNYQDDIYTPLPFTKLHEIAMDTIFKGYLKKNKEGKWEINDVFFGAMENKNNTSVTTGYGSCFECKNFEEYVLYRIRENWEREIQ